jgi:phosphoglycerate dehydrogenase-like enzyme
MRYAAERCNLADSIAELREMAAGRDYVLAEAAASRGVVVRMAPRRMSDTSSLLPEC